MIVRITCFFFAILLFLSINAESEPNNSIIMNEKKNWNLYQEQIDNKNLCYIGSIATEGISNFQKNDSYILITYTNDKEYEISVNFGFQILSTESNVFLHINGKKYNLVIENKYGFIKNNRENTAIIKELLNNLIIEIEVKGRLKNGKNFSDIYSNNGLQSTLSIMSEKCSIF